MALGPRLDLRQSQSLVMTPQLQQAIKLLALSNLEIEGFIAEELEKNPLLEQGASEAEREAEPPDPGGDEFDGLDLPEPETADRLMVAGDAEGDSPLDVDYRAETFHHDSPSDSIVDNFARAASMAAVPTKGPTSKASPRRACRSTSISSRKRVRHSRASGWSSRAI